MWRPSEPPVAKVENELGLPLGALIYTKSLHGGMLSGSTFATGRMGSIQRAQRLRRGRHAVSDLAPPARNAGLTMWCKYKESRQKMVTFDVNVFASQELRIHEARPSKAPTDISKFHV